MVDSAEAFGLAYLYDEGKGMTEETKTEQPVEESAIDVLNKRLQALELSIQEKDATISTLSGQLDKVIDVNKELTARKAVVDNASGPTPEEMTGNEITKAILDSFGIKQY